MDNTMAVEPIGTDKFQLDVSTIGMALMVGSMVVLAAIKLQELIADAKSDQAANLSLQQRVAALSYELDVANESLRHMGTQLKTQVVEDDDDETSPDTEAV